MKTLIPAAIRCSLMFTGVAVLSLGNPASVQAVPTTYQYIGNPFTFGSGPYTTSDFVTVMFTLADPLAPNMPITVIAPIAYRLSDGVQIITNSTFFELATGAAGQITDWLILADTDPSSFGGIIETTTAPAIGFLDIGILNLQSEGLNFGPPGTWTTLESVADTGSTLPLITLTLMALCLVAQQFKRAVG